MKINDLLAWGEPKTVQTKFGRRQLRKARPNDQFWAIWRAQKAGLQDAGVSVTKDGGDWQACWWQPVETLIEESRAVSAEIDVPAPEGLAYLPYQKAGISYALQAEHTMIADEMGLGKTIQAIGVLNSCPTERNVLILCPASLKLNWEREVRKWDTCGRTVEVVKTGSWKGVFQDQVTILNFELAVKMDFRGVVFDRVVVDEAHRLKNDKAKSTRAVYGYWDKKQAKWVQGIDCRHWLLLTGTPILNRPVELWTAAQKLDPDGLGRNFFRFANRYCAAFRDRYGYNTSGASNLEELQHLMREKFLVRRKKSEVLKELPPKIRQVIPLAANGAQRLVDKERKLFTARKAKMEELVYRRELAKASDKPDEYEEAIRALREEIQVAFTEMATVRRDLALAKLPAVIDHLQDAITVDNPVICFCWHKAMIDCLKEAFPDAVVVDGRVSQDKRQQAVDDFQAGKALLFIGNIRAAGVGLTLTASSHVLFAELDWVPGNLTQAEDRAHRIGQKNPVLVQHLVVDGSLDAEMAYRCVKKQKVADSALDLATGIEVQTPGDEPATVDLDWDAVERELKKNEVSEELRNAVHVGLEMLARVCDGAREKDEVGFNGCDSRFGKWLASQTKLTDRHVVLGRKILWKYHKQLPEAVNLALRKNVTNAKKQVFE